MSETVQNTVKIAIEILIHIQNMRQVRYLNYVDLLSVIESSSSTKYRMMNAMLADGSRKFWGDRDRRRRENRGSEGAE